MMDPPESSASARALTIRTETVHAACDLHDASGMDAKAIRQAAFTTRAGRSANTLEYDRPYLAIAEHEPAAFQSEQAWLISADAIRGENFLQLPLTDVAICQMTETD